MLELLEAYSNQFDQNTTVKIINTLDDYLTNHKDDINIYVKVAKSLNSLNYETLAF